MKTKLLWGFSLLLISCSVDPLEEEYTGVMEINVAHDEDIGCAGADNTTTITYSEALAIESWDEVRKLYLNLLEDGISRDGSFDPSIWALIDDFQERGIGDYTTTYYLEGDCEDSVILTVSVVEDLVQEPVCELEAGPDNSMSITQSEAQAIESWDEVRKLYLKLLDASVPKDGEFDPSIWDLINAYNDAENPLGSYTTTYTITDGECSDSVELTVNVIANDGGQQEPPACEGVNAGADNSKTITVSEATALPSWDEVRKLYLKLLEPGIRTDGTFDPSIWNLIDAFNANENPVGEYTTTYTIVNGECSDSVELTIVVVQDPS